MPNNHLDMLNAQKASLTSSRDQSNRNDIPERTPANNEIIERLDIIVHLLSKYDRGTCIQEPISYPLMPYDKNIEDTKKRALLLERTVCSITKLKAICNTMQLGGDMSKTTLTDAIAQISDNLVDLSNYYKITGDDLRNADHKQDLTLADIYPRPSVTRPNIEG